MKNRYFKIHKQQNRVLVIGARHSDFLVFKENVIQHLSSSIESNTDYNIQLEEVIEGDDVSYSFLPITNKKLKATITKFPLTTYLDITSLILRL